MMINYSGIVKNEMPRAHGSTHSTVLFTCRTKLKYKFAAGEYRGDSKNLPPPVPHPLPHLLSQKQCVFACIM